MITKQRTHGVDSSCEMCGREWYTRSDDRDDLTEHPACPSCEQNATGIEPPPLWTSGNAPGERFNGSRYIVTVALPEGYNAILVAWWYCGHWLNNTNGNRIDGDVIAWMVAPAVYPEAKQ